MFFIDMCACSRNKRLFELVGRLLCLSESVQIVAASVRNKMGYPWGMFVSGYNYK